MCSRLNVCDIIDCLHSEEDYPYEEIKSYEYVPLSSTKPIVLSNGTIICSDLRQMDAILECINSDACEVNYYSLILHYIQDITVEDMIKICNLIALTDKILNFYILSCSFSIEDFSNPDRIQYMDKILTDKCILGKFVVSNTYVHPIILCTLWKFIPNEIKFCGINDINTFKMFCHMLNFYDSRDYYIDLSVSIGKSDCMDYFIKTLMDNHTITRLSVSCNIEESQMKRLCKVLAANKIITHLKISTSYLTKYSIGECIATLINNNTTLIELDISECKLGFYEQERTHHYIPISEPQFLESLGNNTTLSKLKLEIVTGYMLKLIGEAISKNCCLNVIHMNFTDRYAFHHFEDVIEPALTVNTHIVSLYAMRRTTKEEWERYDKCPDYEEIFY